jgi:hypothetical protein
VTPLEQFVSAKTLAEYRAAMTDLIKAKALHEAARDPEFRRSLSRVEEISLKRDDEYQLEAFALVCKVAMLVRSLQPALAKTIGLAIGALPASLEPLADVDDRFYAATFWRFAPDLKMAEFLSNNVVAEETAELVRKELMEGLVTVTGRYDQALRFLSRSLHSVKLAADDPGSSVARRIRRCLASLRHAMSETGVRNMGPEFGSELRELVRQAYSRTGQPKLPKPKQEAAIEVIDVITTAVRMRLSIAFEGETYSVLFSLRDWFDPTGWRKFTEHHVVKVLTNDIADALEISVRSGRENRQLLEALSLSAGDEDSFQTKREEIISQNLGLSEELVAWLRGKRVSIKTSLSTESQIGRIEQSVAALMLDVTLLSSLANEIEADVLPAMELFDSIPLEPLKRQLKTIRSVESVLSEVAFERRLSLFGQAGDVVRYSGFEHQFEDERQLGSQMVRIIRSGIMSTATNGQRTVVMRALVKAHS